jgi:hypothetical protein
MSLPTPDIEKLNGALKIWHLFLDKISKDVLNALDLNSSHDRRVSREVILQQEGKDFFLISSYYNGDVHLIRREVSQWEINLLFGIREPPNNVAVEYELQITLNEKGSSPKRGERKELSISEEEVQLLLPVIEEELQAVLVDDFPCQVHLAISLEEEKKPRCFVTIHYVDLFAQYDELKDKCLKCRKLPREAHYVCSQCIGKAGSSDECGEESHRHMLEYAFGPNDDDMPSVLYLPDIPLKDGKMVTVWMNLISQQRPSRKALLPPGYIFSFPSSKGKESSDDSPKKIDE